jgi:hypothetical protein
MQQEHMSKHQEIQEQKPDQQLVSHHHRMIISK